MKRVFVGFAAVPFLAGVAMAGQPMAMSDAQMDRVTAGIEINIVSGDTGATNLVELVLAPPPRVLGIQTGNDPHQPPAGFTIISPGPERTFEGVELQYNITLLTVRPGS